MYIGKCEANEEESFGSTQIPTQNSHQTRSSTKQLMMKGLPELSTVAVEGTQAGSNMESESYQVEGLEAEKFDGRSKELEERVLFRTTSKVFLYSIVSSLFIKGVGYMIAIEAIRSQYYQLHMNLLTFNYFLQDSCI